VVIDTSHKPDPHPGPDATREPAKDLKITQNVVPSGMQLIPKRLAHYIARRLVPLK